MWTIFQELICAVQMEIKKLHSIAIINTQLCIKLKHATVGALNHPYIWNPITVFYILLQHIQRIQHPRSPISFRQAGEGSPAPASPLKL